MLNISKKLSTILITYVLTEYVVLGIIYSVIFFNISNNDYKVFTFFHVLNKHQLIDFVFILIQYIFDFFMIGYLISWKFKYLFQEIFTIDKIKKTYKVGIFLSVTLVFGTNFLTFFKKIPHLAIIYFNIINPYYFIFLLKILILGPVFEEIIYRGIIYNAVKKKYGFIIGLISNSLIFGMAHIKDFTSISYYTCVTVGIEILLALFLTYLYEKTEQLCWPIAMHSFVNFFVTIRDFP